METIQIGKAFKATERQTDLARAWHDPTVTRLLASGAIRSGKTQAAGRILVETALTRPAQYGVFRATYRELEDSTKRAMMYGDGALPPLVPPEAVKDFLKSDNRVLLHGGGELVFRSLEENATEKIRGLTLAGALVDQIEELYYDEGEHLYDELLGRLSDGRGPKKLLAVANPAGETHWLYKRFPVGPESKPDPGTAAVHFTLFDNEENLDPDYVQSMRDTKVGRPGWYRTFVLGEWGAIELSAYQLEQEHRVSGIQIPASWPRREGMDHGLRQGAWLACATDYDGNIIVHHELYRGGLPSEIAPIVLGLRESWGEPDLVVGDPNSLAITAAALNRWGKRGTLQNEYENEGVSIRLGDDNPRAGYARILELMRLDPARRFPDWHPKRGQSGSPAIFFDDRHCPNLVSQIRSAPLQPLDKRDGGEMVDPEWEGRLGHAHAALRYLILSHPQGGARPYEPPADMRQAFLQAHHNDPDDDDRPRRRRVRNRLSFMG